MISLIEDALVVIGFILVVHRVSDFVAACIYQELWYWSKREPERVQRLAKRVDRLLRELSR